MTRQEMAFALAELMAKGDYEEASLLRDQLEESGVTVPIVGYDDIKESHVFFALILSDEYFNFADLDDALIYDLARADLVPSEN